MARNRGQEIAHLVRIGVEPAAADRLVDRWFAALPQPLVWGFDPIDSRPLVTWWPL